MLDTVAECSLEHSVKGNRDECMKKWMMGRSYGPYMPFSTAPIVSRHPPPTFSCLQFTMADDHGYLFHVIFDFAFQAHKMDPSQTNDEVEFELTNRSFLPSPLTLLY